ncbi:HNH endonuclease [Singulisphaera sp. PoT]|uniref:HNH endonuclease n=1 Tax=Singulisphaera sp. PoT TaxID=3411797 RepID=UPI003BF59E40
MTDLLHEVLPNTSGRYSTVGLRKGGKTFTRYVHHLVLEAFRGPCPLGMEACHGDGDSKNNRLDNLRWDTSKANKADMAEHGTLLKGEQVRQARLTEEDVRLAFELRSRGWKHRQIADRLGVSRPAISLVLEGKSWTHLGLTLPVEPTPSVA